MKSKIVLAVTILVTFLLQTTVVKAISLGSISPNLTLILVVSMALMRGRKSGLWVGFFSGLLIDLFYGYPFGFYALVYMYIGYFSGYAHKICYDDDLKVPVMLVTISDFVYNVAVYGLQFLLRGRTGLFTYLYRIILPEVFYSALLALLVYRVFRYINYHFMTPSRKGSESIWVIK